MVPAWPLVRDHKCENCGNRVAKAENPAIVRICAPQTQAIKGTGFAVAASSLNGILLTNSDFNR
jgi:Fe-S-cluster-containing dehydrogenase component